MQEMQHKGWRPAQDMRFAASLEAIALGVAELPLVAQSCPVAFMKSNGTWRAMAVFAPGDSLNRFVDDQTGHWRGHRIPALLRAYPFMLRGRSDDRRLTLWPNAKPEPLDEGVEPFLCDGAPTDRVSRTISFLAGVHDDMAKADAPVAALDDLGVLTPWAPAGFDKPLVLGGKTLWAVDPDRLDALPDPSFLELRHLGALGWIHAHVQSLHFSRYFRAASDESWSQPVVADSVRPDAPGEVTEVMLAMAEDQGDLILY